MEVENLKIFDKKSKRIIRRYLTRAERIGWLPKTTEKFMGVMDSTFQTEIKNRHYQLAVKLERGEAFKENLRRKEKKHHERSIKRTDETLEILKAERKLIKAENLKKMDEIIKDKQKFSKIRDNSIEMLQNSLLGSDIDPTSAIVSLEILNNGFNKVEERGDTNGLLDYIEEQLKELKRLRSEEKNRGREKHNPFPPIPPWKLIGLGALGTLFIGITIACFVDTRIIWISCVDTALKEAGLWIVVFLLAIKYC